MIFVSKCLWGENCKYSGGNNLREELKRSLAGEEVILVCPECQGGLPTPRPASEIEYGKDGSDIVCGCGKVINSEGEDVSREFLKGAQIVLELAEKYNPEKIYLKQGSPSCGKGRIYDGTFSGKTKEGMGVTAALLEEKGYTVIAVE